MKKHVAFHLITLVCTLTLSACGGPTLATPSPKPTDTSLPAATSTPKPTDIPTPTIQPTLALGERQKVDAGGYSFQIPDNFEAKIRLTQATISNKDSTVLISMAMAPRKNDTQTVKTVLSGFLAGVAKDVTDLKPGDPYPATVGSINGLAADLTGTLFGARNTGRVTIVDTGKPGFFIALAFVVDGADGKGWQSEGSNVFDAILDSIQFYEPVGGSTAGLCPVSSDPGFGYTKDNPIKVGGDDFGGPPRERAYLDNLAGPKGEKISYGRTGSMDYGDTILDVFVITGLGKKITLYIDEYSYTEPQAPLGFTCLSAFPLTPP